MKFKMQIKNNKYVLSFFNTTVNCNMDLYVISKYINFNKKTLINLLKKHNGIIYKDNCFEYCVFKNQQDILNCINQLNILLNLLR